MPQNKGEKDRPDVLVLESVWSEDLSDPISVRPFLEGWGASWGIRVSFRSYHSSEDLKYWLSRFWQEGHNPRICYIAGHGNGRRLDGLHKDINLVSAIKDAIPRRPGPQPGVGAKGIHLGVCDVGNQKNLEDILKSTANSLSWVSGYADAVPWTESMLCDLLFLSYLLKGRWRTYDDDERGRVLENGEWRWERSPSAETVGDWVRRDFPLARAFGFNIAVR